MDQEATSESQEAIALRMFPSMASPAAPATTDPPASDAPAPTDGPLLPDNIFDAAIGQTIEVDGQAIVINQEMVQGTLSELRTMATDLDLKADDLATVNEGLAQGATLKSNPEGVIAARESAVEMLNAEHGQEAMLAARCARAYVAANPKLADLLDRSGAGDSPQAITLIARRALALHKGGKLDLPGAPQPRSVAQGFYKNSMMNP